MQGQAKSPKRNRGWLWLLVGVLVIVVLIAPVIRGYSLQSRAGKLIRAYVNNLEASETNPTKGNFYCLLPSFYDMSKSEELDQAIAWLNKVRSLAPQNVYTNFLLGQALCLKQDYVQAIDGFTKYLSQHPDNLLAKTEVGFAAVALSRSTADPQLKQTHLSKGLQSLEEPGFSNNFYIKLGDECIKKEKYKDALFWYDISDAFSGLQGVASFRYALLQLVFLGSSPHADQIKEGMILELDEELTIEPTDLFELSTGAGLQTRIEDGQTTGILYTNYQDAGIMLHVMDSNKYCIYIHAVDKPPAVTLIGVDIDLVSFSVLELEKGNSDWVELSLESYLEPGMHLLTLKLINDGNESGIDRNGYVGSISINVCLES